MLTNVTPLAHLSGFTYIRTGNRHSMQTATRRSSKEEKLVYCSILPQQTYVPTGPLWFYWSA